MGVAGTTGEAASVSSGEKSKGIKVMIMAGGTGGHVFPALAVAKALQAKHVEVCWLGTPRGIENDVVPKAGIQLDRVDIVGVRGKSKLTWLRLPWLLLKSLRQALAVLRAANVDAVIGFGGFASGPGGVAARLLGKPLLIHEQNAVAGTANRLLAKMASARFAAFPNSLPGAQVVGNPVREEIVAIPSPEQRLARKTEKRRLLVLGGSLGALKLNQMLPKALAQVDQEFEVWHQCGRAHLEVTEAAYRDAKVPARVEAFLDDLGAAYFWADLVVCRAGALTVSELTAAGVASILVPYPHAIDDHQTHNARWLVENNAGVLLPEKELNAQTLAQELNGLIANTQQLRSMAINARRLALPNAANDVANSCLQLLGAEVAHV